MRRLLLVALVVPLTGCGAASEDHTGSASEDHTGGSSVTYRLPDRPAASSFVDRVDNPYFPLPVGATWTYRMHAEDGVELDTVHVTDRTRLVDGVRAVVVHDQVTRDGVRIENTWDWYAQDAQGNVWYLGEDTTAYEHGRPPSKEGSWEAGKDGAKPGLIMPAHPRVGDRYQQEYLPKVAEDRGEIVATDRSGQVPWGRFDHAVRTLDTTPLEPHLKEYKYYAKGVGITLEEEEGTRNELISYRTTR